MARTRYRTIDNKLPRYAQVMRNVGIMAGKPYVKVGYPQESAETSAPKRVNVEGDKKGFAHAALDLIDVVVWMEFGTRTVPERSFIRATADEIRAEMRGYIQGLLARLSDGSISVEQALDLVALKVIKHTKERIRRGIDPKLALRTIAAKGSSTPLIDTSQLLNGMTFVRIMKGT
jgi:hypothetical protein